MVQPHRIPTVATLILLLLLQPALEAKKSKRKVICPIGFQIAYTNVDGEPLCYRLKGPEKLTDKYTGCTGNLYTSKLYDSLNLTKSELVLWTEYKSLYPGGPFIDYSFTKSTGSLLETTFEVYNPHQGIEEQLCVVIDPVNNFTTARCDEEFYRYCLVEPYVDEDAMSTEGCDEVKGSWRFFSPKATCLLPATAVGGGAVRATWFQSKEICEKRGGTVLYNGWRYSNNPLLHISGSLPVYPLGITYDPQRHSHVVNEDATVSYDFCQSCLDHVHQCYFEFDLNAVDKSIPKYSQELLFCLCVLSLTCISFAKCGKVFFNIRFHLISFF